MINLEPTKFRNSNGMYYGRELFYETSADPDKKNVLYTVKDEDWKGFPSFLQMYLKLSDPSEYLVATQLFGGTKHFEKLTGTAWFKPLLERCRAELEHKLRSEALLRLQAEAASGGKNSFQANKYLMEAGWKKEPVGRPSKQKIEQRAQEMYEANQLMDHEALILKEFGT